MIYKIELKKVTNNLGLNEEILHIGFGDENADNGVIVKEVKKKMTNNLCLTEGPLLKINGPASLPVAMSISHDCLLISHEVGHIYGALACFDPKLQKYVIAVSHNPDYAIGDLID